MKENLKFVGKCILAASPFILAIVFIFLCPMAYMDNEYPARRYTREVLRNDSAYETLILGDSRAMADIMPCELNQDSVNLACGGMTSIENYYVLKEYLRNHEAPKRVVLAFAPFHYSIIDNFWNRTMFFNDLSIADISEVFANARSVGSETLLTDEYGIEVFSNVARLPHVYLPAIFNAKLIGRYGDNKDTLQELSQAKGYGAFGTADGCSDLCYEVNYETLHETGDSALIRRYLLMLMDLCTENGIQVILVQPPMNESSCKELKESYVNQYALFMRSLSDLYPDASVELLIKEYPDEYFGDSSHLNKRGAEIFTEELKSEYNL